jgi:ankyrin repeat protein
LAAGSDVNREDEGATRLWRAAAQGHAKAVAAILNNTRVDPNKINSDTRTTPLYIAAHHGHEDAVKAILRHPDVKVNLGVIGGVPPLLVAAQGGREGVVKALLAEEGIDVNQADPATGVTPLCRACDLGHEHIVDLLLSTDGIDVPLSALRVAARKGRANLMKKMVPHVARNRKEGCPPPSLVGRFPVQLDFETDDTHHDAVVAWGRTLDSSSAATTEPPSTHTCT